MKAAVLTGYRKDFEITEVQDPTITEPNDVIVRVGAAGLCRTDIHLWDGQFDEAHKAADLSLPFVCGHETAGWVEEVGSGVKHLAVGDDMHCTASMFPGVFAPGGFAEYVKTNARALVPLPGNLTPAQVAPLGCAGLTAYRAVRKSLPLAVPGTHTVVLGAGGLGHIGIQALRALSQTEIIVVDRNEAALEHARGWGADHQVLAKDDRSHVAEVRELTGGGGAAVVIDYVGEGGAERDGVELLGPNGVDMLVGYGGKLEVEILGEALFPETSFVGNICGNYNELVELVALVGRGTVNLTTTLFPLDGINDALHALDEGRLIGRGLLTPNEK
jgi:NAD+-dependent secondary alcohol dehydrogenase Adh1